MWYLVCIAAGMTFGFVVNLVNQYLARNIIAALETRIVDLSAENSTLKAEKMNARISEERRGYIEARHELWRDEPEQGP